MTSMKDVNMVWQFMYGFHINRGDNMICGVKETEIIKNMDADNLFKIICKIKKIDYETIIGKLINRIRNSEIDDKDALIKTQETWDEEYIHIVKEEDVLFVYDDLLWSKELAINFFKSDYGDKTESVLKYLWIETTDEEKEVIKIAQECNLDEIRVEMM